MNETSSSNESSDIDSTDLESDWNFPFESAYILAKDVDSEELMTIKASGFLKDAKEVRDAINNEIEYSIENSTMILIFYGSILECRDHKQRMKEKNRTLNRMQIDDLDAPSTSKRIKIESSSSEDDEIPTFALSNKEKLDLITQSINDLNIKISSMDLPVDISNEFKKLQKICQPSSAAQSNVLKKPDILIKSELKTEFIKILLIKKETSEWIEMIQNTKFDDLTQNQSDNIKELFLNGTLQVGSFMRILSRELFGVEQLKTTLLGFGGKFAKGKNLEYPRKWQRERVFNEKDELKLRNILKLIDNEFFSRNEVYKFLVRDKINSYGNELRNSKNIDKIGNRITDYFPRVTKSSNFIGNQEPATSLSINQNVEGSKSDNSIQSDDSEEDMSSD